MSASKERDGNDDASERHGTECRAEEHGDQRARRSERGTDERHQRHVTEAHRFALGHHFAEPSDDRDHPRAGTRPDESIVRRGEHLSFAAEERDHRRGQREHQSEERESVGNQVVHGVGHRDAEQHGAEDGDAKRGECRAEVVHREQPAERDGELDERIHRRDRLVAAAAFARAARSSSRSERSRTTRADCAHCGQRERGRRIDRSCGHRTMQTFRNEPKHAPRMNA